MDPVIIMVIFFIIILGGGLAYYFLVYKKDDETDETSDDSTTTTPTTTTPTTTTPAPATKTPLETLLASGQALQVEELDIFKGKQMPFAISPTGIDTTKVTYSMSLDIIVVKELSEWWYSILSNNNKQDYPIDSTVRRPGVWLTGAKTEFGARKVHIDHANANNQQGAIITEFAATIGTYFNLTFVVDNGKGTTYINGVKDSKGEWSWAFTWSTENAWTWNLYNHAESEIKVKNVYWFNKALTADEAKLIGTKQTSGTSMYALPPKNEPEPYSFDEYGTLIF